MIKHSIYQFWRRSRQWEVRARSSDVVDRVRRIRCNTSSRMWITRRWRLTRSMQRWRNTAHWARYELVQDGLLKDDSKRGIWEISEKGRQFLSDQAGK